MDSNSLNTLETVATKLNSAGISWCLYGNYNLILQGMNVPAKSIGAVMNYEDFLKTKEIFLEYNPIGPIDLENGEGQEYKFRIDDVDVVLCGDYDNGFYLEKLNEKSVVTLTLDSTKILALSLESEYQCLKHIGKVEKADKIKEFIDNKNVTGFNN